MGIIQNIGMKKIQENGDRLLKNLQSIDDGIKQIVKATNSNTMIINKNLTDFEKRLEELHHKVDVIAEAVADKEKPQNGQG